KISTAIRIFVIAERAISFAEENGNIATHTPEQVAEGAGQASRQICSHDVQFPVAIKITDRECCCQVSARAERRSGRGNKCAVPFSQKDRNVVIARIGNRQIEDSILVEVSSDHGNRRVPHTPLHRRPVCLLEYSFPRDRLACRGTHTARNQQKNCHALPYRHTSSRAAVLHFYPFHLSPRTNSLRRAGVRSAG